MSKKITCIIPARYESGRFPGKPLAKIKGKAMIDWVYENAMKAEFTGDVILATDSEEIKKHCEEKGYKVQMTKEHRNGSERVGEVAEGLDEEWVFEMQVDQPLLQPDQIDDFLKRAWDLVQKNPDIDVVHPFTEATKEQTDSPDVVNAVVSISDRLLFQTRLPIQTGIRTLGLYLWKNESLQRFSALEKAPIEIIEDTHPVRLYINDFWVQGLPFEGKDWIEVDREHQIKEVEDLMDKKGIK